MSRAAKIDTTLFPNASASFMRFNPDLFPDAKPARAKADRLSQGSQPEPTVRHEPLEADQGKAYYSGRCLVRVTSYRCGRQCDPDNLVGKWFIDSLRYAGIIPDDRPEDIDYQIQGQKVATKKEERTEIEVTQL